MKAIQQKMQQTQRYWLIVSAVSLLGACIFWLVTDKEELHKAEKPIEDDSVEEIQPEKVTATKFLGAFNEEIRPLELTQRVAAVNSDHAPEFRGTKFIQANSKMWTVELFQASEEAVVINYLKQHSQEKDLIYTRLSGDGQEEAYVVLYGKFKTQDAAKQLSEQLVTLDLPESITPKVKQFGGYLKWVNEVGSEELGKTGNGMRTYAVNLKAVALPRPPQPTTTEPAKKPAAEPVPRVVQPSSEALKQTQ